VDAVQERGAQRIPLVFPGGRGTHSRHDPRNHFEIAKQFFWAILEKLSPARRVLLLVGVGLLMAGGADYAARNARGEAVRVSFDLHILAGIILLVLLMMEIADRVVMKRDLEIAKEIQSWLLPAEPLA
jgi:hypothetical protein